MSKSSASNLLKNFCYVEYLHAAAFLSNTLCTIFQSMCTNLICVQIWLQITPDQWLRRGHSNKSPAALELHSLERDKVLTSCITILMSDLHALMHLDNDLQGLWQKGTCNLKLFLYYSNCRFLREKFKNSQSWIGNHSGKESSNFYKGIVKFLRCRCDPLT